MDEEVIDGDDTAGEDLSGHDKQNAEREEVGPAHIVWKHEESGCSAEEGAELVFKSWLPTERGRLPRASVWRTGASDR